MRKFSNQFQFVSWFKDEFKKIFNININGFVPPSAAEKAAEQIFRHYHGEIYLPSPYQGWIGIDDYAKKIWYANYDKLSSEVKEIKFSEGTRKIDNPDRSEPLSPSSKYTVSSNETNIIKRHNFDISLSNIQKTIDKLPPLVEIEKFKTEGWLFSHKITGEEMNQYVEKVQEQFKAHNGIITETIKEFRQVYNTFNYLDKEYLNGIIQAVTSAKKASTGAKVASEQAKKASEQAKNAATKALINEEDIRKEVEVIKKVIDKIKNIKEEFSSKIPKLENSIRAGHDEMIREISKMTLSQNEIVSLKNKFDGILYLQHQLDGLLKNIEYALEELDLFRKSYTINNENLAQIYERHRTELLQHIETLSQTASEQRKEYTDSIETLSLRTEAQFREQTQQIETINLTASEQRKEYTDSIEELGHRTEAQFTEQAQQIETMNQTASEQRKEYIKSIDELGSHIETRFGDQTQQIETLNKTVSENRKEYTASIKELEHSTENKLGIHTQHISALEQVASNQRKEYINSIEEISQKFTCQEQEIANKLDTLNNEILFLQKRCNRNIIIAYILSALGIVGSIIAISI